MNICNICYPKKFRVCLKINFLKYIVFVLAFTFSKIMSARSANTANRHQTADFLKFEILKKAHYELVYHILTWNYAFDWRTDCRTKHAIDPLDVCPVGSISNLISDKTLRSRNVHDLVTPISMYSVQFLIYNQSESYTITFQLFCSCFRNQTRYCKTIGCTLVTFHPVFLAQLIYQETSFVCLHCKDFPLKFIANMFPTYFRSYICQKVNYKRFAYNL